MRRLTKSAKGISSVNGLAQNLAEIPQAKAIVYRITTGTIQGQISVNDKGVVIAATLPVRHLEGRLLPNVEAWVRSNQGVIEKVLRQED